MLSFEFRHSVREYGPYFLYIDYTAVVARVTPLRLQFLDPLF